MYYHKFTRWLGLICLATTFLLLHSQQVTAVDVSADETVVFFPTTASLNKAGTEWDVPIHGWIFELEEDAIRKGAVKSALKSFDIEKDSAEAKTLAARAAFFLADNERNQDVEIRVGNRIIELEESERDGHFFGRFSLAVAEAKRLAPNGHLTYQAVMPQVDRRRFSGTVQLVGWTGLSVISDIDDTIKVTQVTSKRKAIENTFLKPFQEAAGMSAVYRTWATKGVTFHFVSSSPYQLTVPLTTFMRNKRFPPASLHLKRTRLKDASVLLLTTSSTITKPPQIETLLKQYPEREFILVGDSGENDPEVYGDIARRYRAQIRHIAIRNVTSEDPESSRFQRAFRSIPRSRWLVFDRANELSVIKP